MSAPCIHPAAGFHTGWHSVCLNTSQNVLLTNSLYALYAVPQYIANNLKHHVGVGTHITTDMVVHHIATVSLVTLSYIANFKRIGMLAMVVFNAANPLLHASRVSLYLRLQRAKFCCFVLFTLAFITTRVVALPAVVLRCTLLDTLTVGVSRPAYLTLNGALITLYALQLVWLYKILEILAAGERTMQSGRRLALTVFIKV